MEQYHVSYSEGRAIHGHVERNGMAERVLHLNRKMGH